MFHVSRALLELLSSFFFLALKEPMDAIFVGEMSVASKREIPQVVQQVFVGSRGELVEDRSQLFVLPTVNVHGDSVALFRFSLGVEPVRG